VTVLALTILDNIVKLLHVIHHVNMDLVLQSIIVIVLVFNTMVHFAKMPSVIVEDVKMEGTVLLQTSVLV